MSGKSLSSRKLRDWKFRCFVEIGANREIDASVKIESSSSCNNTRCRRRGALMMCTVNELILKNTTFQRNQF